MGFSMSQAECKFHIDADDKGKALRAVKALVKKTKVTWADEAEVEGAKNLCDAMAALNWEIEEDEGGAVVGIMFTGEKAGDEDKVFGALAPFVKDGSFIEMTGDEAAHWRWVFADGKCTHKSPTVTWS